jgi:hypothetical protein
VARPCEILGWYVLIEMHLEAFRLDDVQVSALSEERKLEVILITVIKE